MTEAWQHIPGNIVPTAFVVGPFSVHWYAVLYSAGLLAGLAFLLLRSRQGRLPLDQDGTWDMVMILLIGILVGGRVGYALAYNFGFFSTHPLFLVWPYDPIRGTWIGIAGMSFHGSLAGAAAGLWWYARRGGLSFAVLSDEVALIAPLGLFLGRIGNFLNGELYGRVTTAAWGMHFPGTLPIDALRYPSQLVEALGEGALLAVFLWWCAISCGHRIPGTVTLLFLTGYGSIRFLAEFLREPDPQIGFTPVFGLTMGQLLSVVMVLIGLWGWHILYRRGILKTKGNP